MTPAILLAAVLAQAPVAPIAPTPAALPPTPPATAETAPAAAEKVPPAPDTTKWDVATPPVAADVYHDVPIDVTEGTWMNVDLSPDGTTLVFDMLGDIYTMPATGSADGSAVMCIAGGLQWDMQPRWSPDGGWITFTSDRTGENGKGGDNIWVMKADGSQLRQITKETFRLFTQPVWTSDGTSIIARKHFTSRRSLGSGEMWMFHASGKLDGLQLTSKASEQKDVGEPAVSPDGQYVYYSLDASPGGGFEYDKDSTGGIYAIDRLNLKTGETVRLIAGPGGACRPTPSPDGKQIAFVRRVRYRTTLFVMDIASSEARPVYDKLERDNQETWAVHGVAPQIAWTKDGKELITWAAGKIHRISAATGQATEIPFRVKGTRAMATAQRFATEVAPAEFDIKMLRDVRVSPMGDKVAFQALGHIYVRDLAAPAGTISRRLTDSSDEFEFFPTWSRDGTRIAFVSWNDKKMGSVKVATAGGTPAATFTATTDPGHYVDPVFTPDGKSIVYTKTSGGYLTSPLWSQETGLYITEASAAPSGAAAGVPATNLGPRLLSRRGSSPQFAADSQRVFLTVREGNSDSDRVALISIPLGGITPAESERTHYRSDWATEYAISPDGKFVAFAERFNVYVAAFIATGRTIDVGPKSSAFPLVKLTKEAGSNIGWSGDSSKLYWSLGPTLYTQDARSAIAAVSAVPAADPAPATPVAAETALGWKHKQAVPTAAGGGESSVLITNVKILTMEDAGPSAAERGMKVIENSAILITGNRISAVGSAAGMTVPAGTPTLDGAGATVMPGIIDVHAHGGQSENGITPQNNWISLANLAFGVTTIHDPSNDTESIFAASELAKAGDMLAPRTYSTGTILYGATGAFKAEIDSLEDAQFHLRRMKAVGAFSVKSYNQPRRDQRQMVMEAARREKMLVVPEGGALYMHNMTMVADGHTSVEHTLPIENIYDDVVQFWGASKTGYTPTLGVAYGGMGGENYWYAKTNVWENTRLMNFVPRYVVDPRSRRRTDAPDSDWNHIKQAAIAKKLMDAGVRPTIGAHGQLAGLAAHWEMAMFVQGGMKPMEALRAATIDGAWYIGLDKDLGSITPGKLADFIVLDKDPSADIANSQSIRWTVLNGRVYDSMTMAQVAPVQVARPELFFERLQRGSSTPLALEAIMRHASGCAGCGRPGCGSGAP